MSVDYFPMLLSAYLIAGVIFVTLISQRSFKTRLYHVIIALTVFIPVALTFVALNLATLAIHKIKRQFIKED